MTETEPRLTSLAHGGGCGCKLSPSVLGDLLSKMPVPGNWPDLLVGNDTSDDAAVYRISADQAVVATTDFFMPIVDDPHDFGRIAATNALSDIYAMGATPIMALALLGMPAGRVSPATVSRILAGGAEACQGAGVPVAGGHSIDSEELIYGLAVIGLVHPDRLRRNGGARAGDRLVLTKGLGIGIISAALKKDDLPLVQKQAAYDTLVASTTRLNAVGAVLADMAPVHAMTDVTGFGLLGHALEVCRGSGLQAVIEAAAVPVLEGVEALARVPYRTGAATRNWQSFGAGVDLAPGLADWQRDLFCDPQTSGGLLISVAPDGVDAVLATLRTSGAEEAVVIGEMVAGTPGITVR
jgi:selenide, water dikinase